MSHPVWVRGLKQFALLVVLLPFRSHPVWVRGLKQTIVTRYSSYPKVAPRVGAWIETIVKRANGYQSPVGRTPCGCVD